MDGENSVSATAVHFLSHGIFQGKVMGKKARQISATAIFSFALIQTSQIFVQMTLILKNSDLAIKLDPHNLFVVDISCDCSLERLFIFSATFPCGKFHQYRC